jgi:hypothetical protein
MSFPTLRNYRLLAVAILLIACAAVTMAQVKQTASEQKGQATKEVTIERGEVVYVSGNEVVVKMENGEIRHVTVPDGARAMINGKEIGIADLKPGMKLERTITTTSTPKTVQTVRTGTGTVVNVMPPNSVTVRFEDNTVQQFKIPKNQKFNIDGRDLTAFELKPGMKITATRITTAPAVEVTSAKSITGTAPPPPPPPATPTIQGALLIAEPVTMPPPATMAPAPPPPPPPAPEPAPKTLPRTGSLVPLIGLLGLLFSGASIGVRMLRRS